MGTLQRREHRGLLPDLFDWVEAPVGMLRTGTEPAMRVEDYREDGDHIVRAELPGIDPEKDVEITVTGDVLRIHAERHEEKKEDHRSEFRYGAFTRSFTLPAETRADDITASYDQGILTVRIPVHPAAAPEAKRIAVAK
ncbi:Hsp20/alpha crystallin family protein [Actinomadura sp. WMMB 499]|uniref:Hsp20/alpha crystallin family protein n=1 Tax=Actinomadura sp. WMMB 499 TaxID=1219491 RepID=UPI0012488913|nr:Hsp20/alpha crystallin family protein [Actinomadura sp. WMMB 499]QFG21283.1 Hsp20/alpha crystallin family protein [Actinomadura sp. WMMB 499]